MAIYVVILKEAFRMDTHTGIINKSGCVAPEIVTGNGKVMPNALVNI